MLHRAVAWRHGKPNPYVKLDLNKVGETGYGADIRCTICKVYKAQEGEC